MEIKANDKLRVIRASFTSDLLPLGAIVYAMSNASKHDVIQVSAKLDGVEKLRGTWDADRFEHVTDSVDFDKPVQTRDGRTVTIITTKSRAALYPVMAYIGKSDNIQNFTAEGKFYANGEVSDADIMNVPVEITTYINVYPAGLDACTHATRAEADSAAGINRIGCNRVVLTPTFDN